MKFRTDENTNSHTVRSNVVPEPYRELLIPLAGVTYTEGNFGSILSQEIKGLDYSICQHHFFINEDCKLYAVTERPLLAINYMLRGSLLAKSPDIGDFFLKEGTCQMFYVPTVAQELIFAHGSYNSIHINVNPSYLKEVAVKHPKLLQLIGHAARHSDQLASDTPVKIKTQSRAILKDIIYSVGDPGERDLQLRAKIIELLLGYIRKHYNMDISTDAEQGKLLSVERFIHENLAKPLHIADLARLSGKSQSEFHRLFKLHFNESPHHFIQRLRVANAMELILSTDYPISQIAIMVGFDDPAHFSKAFKRIHGTPPSQFRDNHSKSQEKYTSEKI
ncbi:helix-turn-helix protein [Mucilaginibacter gracilis]|uniref:Helix-turn-helix protein n=1 Tax=Mucilaginibacter gracilis TaxID=423350 RepID=A0A495J737_9SPHI|nr:AraC family transcriptional regulator [Mucilaginibacter gracilis]RKR84412.1 helix-turn-helix protein [Mucilaginibacter gracilis]